MENYYLENEAVILSIDAGVFKRKRRQKLTDELRLKAFDRNAISSRRSLGEPDIDFIKCNRAISDLEYWNDIAAKYAMSLNIGTNETFKNEFLNKIKETKNGL